MTNILQNSKNIIMRTDISLLSMPALKECLAVLPRTTEADREFADRIVRNDKEAVDYFINDFSRPILNYVYAHVLWLSPCAEAYQELNGDYYLFIGAPFKPGPGWARVNAYEARNGAKLYSYVSRMTANHFRHKRNDYAASDNNKSQMMKYVDYQTLLALDFSDEDDRPEKMKSCELVRKAYKLLSEEDKEILNWLCIKKMHWSDAFEKLRKYMNPSGPDGQWQNYSFEEKQSAMDREWMPKQKQFAIAGLKKRAVLHLMRRYYKLIEEEYA